MAIDINKVNEMFVVEWNESQNKPQIRALGELLKSNLFALVKRKNCAYVPVAIAHTEREALEMSELIETKLKRRNHSADSSDTLH